jgi:O-antigen/teichoic acid export membrane protein
MEPASSYLWRKSDRRLVNQAFTSFAIIFFLGLVIAGLYFLSPPPTRILGSQISAGGQ